MIHKKLIDPRSIVVVGGSNDTTKPGGKVLRNIIDGNFRGSIYALNKKDHYVQGVKTFADPSELPDVDMAVIAVASRFVPEIVEVLAKNKETRAFVVISAGFSEESSEGKQLEKQLVDIVNSVNGTLIGPNCVGVLTPNHHSIFSHPIPKLDPKGCDFISGSGATAGFIMESGISKGLTFANVLSVGNSAQVGVEEILKHMDEVFDIEKSSHVKLLYIENISKPRMFLKHASSLIRKGCKIAAIKAGSSEAGSRAASSHTGALATPDLVVDALFKKAGILRCYGREELVCVASIFMHQPLNGNNIAIITHAGGPAIMLTDTLSKGNMKVPELDTSWSNKLSTHLFPGSAVDNPIDFLATGTAEQLGLIIDYVEKKFKNINGMIVIFGSPGLFPVFNVYDVLHRKMKECKKPIYPVLPSLMTAKEEVGDFISKGRINFPDEVTLGNALSRVFYNPTPPTEDLNRPSISAGKIRRIIDDSPDGYLDPLNVQQLLDAAGIKRVEEMVAYTLKEALEAAERLGMPLAMKVVGPVHKSDVKGVVLNIKDEGSLKAEFERLMQIKDAKAVLLQPMIRGRELYAGAKYEKNFGHIIFCGLGGTFVEVFKDISSCLAPVSYPEAEKMIRSLKSYEIIKGFRGQDGINEVIFADILVRLSALAEAADGIYEMDLNPLLGDLNQLVAVDARINIRKQL